VIGWPRLRVGKCDDRRALYLAAVQDTEVPNWRYWQVWHVRLGWPPVTKAVDNFVPTDE